jgi:hypothetical protein
MGAVAVVEPARLAAMKVWIVYRDPDVIVA